MEETPDSVVCGGCGQAVTRTDRFCEGCGTQQDGASHLRTASEFIEAETPGY